MFPVGGFTWTGGALLAFLVTTLLAMRVAAALAAMAPEYRRLDEFGEVLDALRVQAPFQLGPIEGITRFDGHTYRVWSGRCYLYATLHWPAVSGPPMPGSDSSPTVELGEPHCQQ